VDGLPAAQEDTREGGETFFRIGFLLGRVVGSDLDDKQSAYFHNHYDIRIDYHTKDYVTFRIVGLVVVPHSVKSMDKASNCNYNKKPPSLSLSETSTTKVTFTYNVAWTVRDQLFCHFRDNFCGL
jgi:transmembrane 9 superfamily protein 2/4